VSVREEGAPASQIVLPGGSSRAAAGPAPVRRFEHGSRVPGWDEAVDLEKDPALIPDPGQVQVPEGLRAEIEARMSDYPDRHSAVLPALRAAQELYGWCSPEAFEQVACVMRVTPAYLESVATFYDMLELHPVPAHSVFVCTNISCSLLGADALYDALGAQAGEVANVRSFECLGACDIGPMASVDGVYIGPLSTADVPTLLEDLRAGREVLPDRHLSRRPVADRRGRESSGEGAGDAGKLPGATAETPGPDDGPSEEGS